MKNKLFLTIVFVLVLSLLFTGCSEPPSNKPVLMESSKGEMITVTAQYQDVYDLEYVVGCVLPQSEKILLPASVKLVSIEALPGQKVKKGDVLAQFNADELQKQLDSLQAEFARMQAAAENEMNQLELSYQQVKAQQAQLESSGAPEYILELSDIDAWEAWMRIEHTEQIQEVEQRRIKNEIAKLEVKLAESSQIVAPCDGIVTWLSPQAVCGMELLKGTEFMTISDPNKLCVVTERQSDEYRQLCDRIYAVIGNNEYDLTMRERSKDEDMLMKEKGYRFTSTFDFSGDAPESSDAVSNAMVLFVKKYRENVLSVPSETVQEHAGSYYVYTVENGALIQTDVQVGAITALRTEILSGLEEGDVVYVTSY